LLLALPAFARLEVQEEQVEEEQVQEEQEQVAQARLEGLVLIDANASQQASDLRRAGSDSRPFLVANPYLFERGAG
jgi:hypothetical protein